MQSWRLTPRAEDSLVRIARWTIENFGVEQADRYRRQLIDRIEAIGAGEFPEGRSCSVLVSDATDASELRYSVVGRHYVVYRAAEDELQIIDFIHGARDFEAALSATR